MVLIRRIRFCCWANQAARMHHAPDISWARLLGTTGTTSGLTSSPTSPALLRASRACHCFVVTAIKFADIRADMCVRLGAGRQICILATCHRHGSNTGLIWRPQRCGLMPNSVQNLQTVSWAMLSWHDSVMTSFDKCHDKFFLIHFFVLLITTKSAEKQIIQYGSTIRSDYACF